MTIHEVHTMAAQGDVVLRRVERLPSEAKRVARKGTQVIVAHSETGHHHAIEAEGVIQFDVGDPLVCYLQLDGIAHADLVHHRPWDTHETLRLLGTPGQSTFFEVRRQREYTPDGWRKVED